MIGRRKWDTKKEGLELTTICSQLKLKLQDGKISQKLLHFYKEKGIII